MRLKIVLATMWVLAAAAPALPPGQATPVAHPYDETEDAHAAVAAAFTRAKLTGRIVLLDFGGNWCPDCRMLAGVLEDPRVKQWTDQNFQVVMIDVGRFKKNLDIAARWGVTLHAAPTVLAVTPQGKLLNGDDVTGLADARSFSEQAVVDMLARMAKT
jgi:thiol-disulfide isomerase/thioredoxin